MRILSVRVGRWLIAAGMMSSLGGWFFLGTLTDSNRRQNTKMFLVKGNRSSYAASLTQSRSYDEADLKQQQLLQQIMNVAKLIVQAKKHVRGSKTSDFLKRAIENMNRVLEHFDMEPTKVYQRQTEASKSVCPEEFKGTTYGYPFFYKGFETTDCDYGLPINKLVTILKLFTLSGTRNVTGDAIERFVSTANRTYPGIRVIAAIPTDYRIVDFKSNGSVEMFPYFNLSEGLALNEMITKIKTPYVLIARETQVITNDTRLSRLIREIESLNVSVAAGATKDLRGYWNKGCYQTVYRNFTVKYLEGYDESLHECMFCDFVDGPFVVSKQLLETQGFSDLNSEEGLYEDWFLNLFTQSKETLVCPDSMFNIESPSKMQSSMQKLMSEWNLFKLVSSNGQIYTRDCSGQRPNIARRSQLLSPCDRQANADLVKAIMSVCESGGIICELQEGTSLGAVKFGNVLPWERDADLAFLTANFTKLKQLLVSEFNSKGGRLQGLKEPWCCVDGRKAGGVMHLVSHGWNVEFYGQHMMDSELLAAEGLTPTKVLLDGKWVGAPRNPGLFARNRYGKEIYQHAQHWFATGGKSGWQNYKTNIFNRCEKPGAHDCLDRYNADGNLPFVEMLP